MAETSGPTPMMTENPTGHQVGKDTPITLHLLNRDGEIDYMAAFLEPDEADRLLLNLMNTLDWREETLRIAGKTISVPRRVAWHGDTGAVYRYSGTTHEPEPWTPALLELKTRLEACCHRPFNSMLGNLYRDGQDAMGWHADKEPELGPAPFIASLSLGAERRFEIRHNRSRETLGMPLAHGSLLTMGGAFQTRWKHRVPRQPSVTGVRINLSFRNIIPVR